MTDTLAGMTVAQIRAKARADAVEVLGEYWFPNRLPVDPISIARQLGASVFSADLGPDTWGMLVGTSGGAAIYLDRLQPINRYRFSCAHEIGHLVDRGRDIADGKALVEKRTDQSRGRADEIYANEFAASLLMPEAHLRAAVAVGEDNFDLAQRFEVSLESVTYHRRLLGI